MSASYTLVSARASVSVVFCTRECQHTWQSSALRRCLRKGPVPWTRPRWRMALARAVSRPPQTRGAGAVQAPLRVIHSVCAGSCLEVCGALRCCRSPLSLGGMSSQLSARQPRAAPCRACRRGCCARWPQRWSTTGTATVLVLELVHTTTCQVLVSTAVSWSSCIGRGHCLWRPWAGRCCMPRVFVVESVS